MSPQYIIKNKKKCGKCGKKHTKDTVKKAIKKASKRKKINLKQLRKELS